MNNDFDKIVCVISVSKIPQNNALRELHSVLSFGLMVNYVTGEIVDMSTTFISQNVETFLKKLVVGRNIHEESIEQIIEDVNFLYQGTAQKAVCSCLKLNYIKYFNWRKEYKLDN